MQHENAENVASLEEVEVAFILIQYIINTNLNKSEKKLEKKLNRNFVKITN